MTQTPLRILHLSDLHFASGMVLDPSRHRVPDSYHYTPERNLISHLESETLPKQFDLIAVTGDIADKARQEGFETFDKTLMPLLKSRVDDHSRICIVPGNHDVLRQATLSQDYYDQKFSAFRGIIEAHDVTTCLLPTGDQQNLTFQEPSSGPIFVDEQKKLLVACLNSAIRCGEPSESKTERSNQIETLFRNASRVKQVEATWKKIKHLLNQDLVEDIAEITQTQIHRIRKLLDAKKGNLSEWNQYFRIALLHHHLVPFPEQQVDHSTYDPVLDASFVLNILDEYGFHLVLTGHKHQPYFLDQTTNGKQLAIIGSPTICGEAPKGSGYGFSWLEISPNSTENHHLKLFGLRTDGHNGQLPMHGTSCDFGHKSESCKYSDSTNHFFLRKDEPKEADNSDLFVAFLGSDNPLELRKELEKNRTKWPYTQIYDTFGSYDIILKIRTGIDGDNAKEKIDSFITQEFKGYIRLKKVYNITDEWTPSKLPDPQTGIHTRREIKAFLLIQDFPFDADTNYFKAIIGDHLTTNGNGHPTGIVHGVFLARSDDVAIIELTFSCGGFYNLVSFNLEIERKLDNLKKQSLLVMKDVSFNEFMERM